ncbi:unknown similar to AMEV198 [Choristoneura rosaceana entomopoxvirus 'L']|uniref:Uncharacterized protein n=1 Tax=Choristoneura rosaceana entomopoxvirus 'L' TaxID=1293539 RepID=A0ABM9QKP0_9POXV|nr:unknown similar to AMEV198 [Choristoneura rosaceana entomopoxvirus 'L']CCU56099.1 unknown similar to AMEV198 [Choristoneura rosaceana entomopoxvirus 'L']
MNNIAGISFAQTLINISNNAVRYILILLLVSFIISLLFIIIQNYVYDENSVWYAVAAYFNIILITLAFFIYVRSMFININTDINGTSTDNLNRNLSNVSYDDSY